MNNYSKEINFPDPDSADETGLVAIGGNLESSTLLNAYRHGIFPWFIHDNQVHWFSPDPRLILIPEKIVVSKSMKQVLNKNNFLFTVDAAFTSVISACRNTRIFINETDTWITPEIIKSYTDLYNLGNAHSVEVWLNNKLTGGLYGVQIGKVFFGESMFSYQSNSSKAALIFLCEHCTKNGIELIDCQQTTSHLLSMGAHVISRKHFLKLLNELI